MMRVVKVLVLLVLPYLVLGSTSNAAAANAAAGIVVGAALDTTTAGTLPRSHSTRRLKKKCEKQCTDKKKECCLQAVKKKWCRSTSCRNGKKQCLTDCKKKCPKPKAGNKCRATTKAGKLKRPFLCKITQKTCRYRNLCLARSAGLQKTVCNRVPNMVKEQEPKCPRTDAVCHTFAATPLAYCGKKYECVYPNLCTATKLFKRESCVEVEPDCPRPIPDGTCKMQYKPVECGTNDCFYANLCDAQRHGYKEDQCKPYEPECPKLKSDTFCVGQYDPVACGEMYGCKYSNQCFASEAGYDKDQCKPYEPECLKPKGEGQCIEIYDPVFCGEMYGCKYSNQCIASKAGYDAGQCKPYVDKCATILCGPEYICLQGKCVDKCATMKCGSGFTCSLGQCVPDED